ncbi:MAG: thioredoxin [Pseudoramibacter sp.]
MYNEYIKDISQFKINVRALRKERTIKMEKQFTQDNFNSEVLGSDVPVMVDFYADWCGPCKMMGPMVEKLANAYDGKIKIGKLNVDEQPALADQYGVSSIPNFVFFKNGKVVDQAIGAMPEAMLNDKLKNLL